MALTLAGLLEDVLNRVEEAQPTDTPPGPVFWSLTGEVYPTMVDAMFEASLISGVVQLVSVPLSLGPNTTYFPLQACATGFGSGYVTPPDLPAGIVAPIRLKAPYGIRKTTLTGLDQMNPKWQTFPPGTQINSWFPIGLSAFGIFPQLANEQTVVMDFLYSPVNESRPYTGNETVPFQAEFSDILSKYAAAQLRAKESGAESEEAEVVFKEYLNEVKDLSLFQTRVDSLIYSGAYGGRSDVNPRSAV